MPSGSDGGDLGGAGLKGAGVVEGCDRLLSEQEEDVVVEGRGGGGVYSGSYTREAR